MRTGEFKDWLKSQFPGVDIKNGAINKDTTQSIGVFNRGNARPYIAVGGADNTSFATLPITILVHWTENADTCEQKAQEVYQKLYGKSDFIIGQTRVISIDLLDPCPVNVDRDTKNIAEMVIRLNLIHER